MKKSASVIKPWACHSELVTFIKTRLIYIKGINKKWKIEKAQAHYNRLLTLIFPIIVIGLLKDPGTATLSYPHVDVVLYYNIAQNGKKFMLYVYFVPFKAQAKGAWLS